MFLKKNILPFIIFTIVVFTLQFIIASKHFNYGFNNDDWYVLAWYKQVVQDPFLDIVKAWREIGSHNFARVYYVGTLFRVFEYNYQLYHIFNTFLKALAGLSVFPLIYLLFRKKSLAYLATFLFSLHFSSFATLHTVFVGNESLVIISMNIFLAIYLWALWKHNFNLKIMFTLLMFLLAASFFDIPRFYPVLILLPFLELLNFWLNRSSTTFKALILRLIFLYSLFIAVVLYSPDAVSKELNINKLKDIFSAGNFQLFISLFASFGSTFIPQGLLDQLSIFARVGNTALYQDFWIFLNFLLFRFLVLSYPILYILGLLVSRKPKWFILRSLFLSISFSILAFLAANNWIYLDPKIKAAVDPGTYFISGIIGIFVFSTSISFFIEWLNKKGNYLVLALSLAPIFSLLYTFFTWILAGDNVIFTGVHAYLSIAAIGSSLYLAIIFYLAFQNLRFKSGVMRKIAAILTVIYFFFFIILSSIQVDKYYADWLKNGYAASDQNRIQTSFWKEVGMDESKDKSPILVYLDTSADDGYFYGASFAWDIPPMLTIEKGLPFDPGGHCKSVIRFKDLDKLRIEEVNSKEMIVQSACGDDRFYKMENFYAFKMINRDLVPIKSEIINKLGFE
ncbi:hypothetical protein KKE03_01820 [Patescibacteria group bacterium]|nr:hypothetical protein [Patescibacteria group bacterium]